MNPTARIARLIAGVAAAFLCTPVLADAVTREPGFVLPLEEIWIPMPDGVRLAADLYLPSSRAAGERVPVLLEYLPYRKDASRDRNQQLYTYFVDRGYAVARVDIRGTGRSEGRVIPYEYSDIELDDGEAVIAWLADQPWSNGNVGMFGISWGGFNSIQMALRNPPALKAFVAVMATENLYLEDVHYMDGIMHMDSWMMTQDLYNALPGAPDFVLDEDWAANRFDIEPSVFTYVRQQRFGPFWSRASAMGRYDEIRVPGFHIGGWFDGYRNSLPRMLENVKNAPVKALIGPWDHYFPHDAWPAPSIEWRHEAVRWFDQFLKGVDTGILDEPRFAVYVRDWHPPDPNLETVPGHWRWEDGWPLARTDWQTWYAQTDHGLRRAPADEAVHRLAYKPSAGVEAGGPVMWWGGVLNDVQPTDDWSLVYDSPPLESDLEILGLPRALLPVSADAPRANWIARLSDVSPDGAVTQITGAAINGAHRESVQNPKDLVPGETVNLDIPMLFTSWVFPKGHRIRLAVNNSQWPMLWPTPYPMTTTLALGGEQGARLLLPVIPPGPETGPTFAPIETVPPTPDYELLDPGNITGYAEVREAKADPETGVLIAIAANTGGQKDKRGIELFEERIEHRTHDEDPANTSMRGTYAIQLELENRVLRMEGEFLFRSDAQDFYLTVTRRMKENGQVIRERTFTDTIPRDFQ